MAVGAILATPTLAVLRFVHLQRAALEVLAVQRLHGARGIRIGHLDEAEAAGTAGVTIVDQGDLVDRAVRGEQLAHGIFGGGKGEVSNVEFGHFEYSFK